MFHHVIRTLYEVYLFKCMKPYQICFLNESKRLAALSRLGGPLEQLSKYVDFKIFRLVLSAAFQKTDLKGPAGRKPVDVILMFKANFNQRLFNLGDEKLDFQIIVRASFTRFLGLHDGETIPDYTSFWGFRESLKEKGREQKLFDQFSAKLAAEGVYTKSIS